MRISVVLAARNAARFLPALLDSLAAQTKSPHELVAYDDASDDATSSLLAEFGANALFPVRVIRRDEWRGHVAGFLEAARLADGDCVAFCDADDVWQPRKLEICAKALERGPAILAMHTTRVVDEGLAPLGRNWPAIARTRLAPPRSLAGLEVDAPGMALVFRRALLDEADFEARPPSRYSDGPMLHDEWVFFLAGVLGPIHLIAEPLVLYRQHGANDSGGWVDHRRDVSLRPAVDDYRRAAAHTGECAGYLERSLAAADGERRQRLSAGACAYRRLSANWDRRVRLYEAPDRRTRARMMARLLAAGAYRKRTAGGFGRAALGKDLVAGVALAMPGLEDPLTSA